MELEQELHQIRESIQELVKQAPPDSEKLFTKLDDISGKLDTLAGTVQHTQSTINNSFEQRKSHFEQLVHTINDSAAATRVGIATDQKAYYDQVKRDSKDGLTLFGAIQFILVTHFTGLAVIAAGCVIGLVLGHLSEDSFKTIFMAYFAGLCTLSLWIAKNRFGVKMDGKK